jgi:hypothetical protein
MKLLFYKYVKKVPNGYDFLIVKDQNPNLKPSDLTRNLELELESYFKSDSEVPENLDLKKCKLTDVVEPQDVPFFFITVK